MFETLSRLDLAGPYDLLAARAEARTDQSRRITAFAGAGRQVPLLFTGRIGEWIRAHDRKYEDGRSQGGCCHGKSGHEQSSCRNCPGDRRSDRKSGR